MPNLSVLPSQLSELANRSSAQAIASSNLLALMARQQDELSKLTLAVGGLAANLTNATGSSSLMISTNLANLVQGLEAIKEQLSRNKK